MMAPLMNVGWLRMKSSAVSVSSVSEAGGWDSAPSRPSGGPVLKKKRIAQEAGAHRVHVEPEHLADVDEREGPVRAIAPHPGLGLRGQPTRAEAALPASLFDTLYRVLQDGEHECTRS